MKLRPAAGCGATYDAGTLTEKFHHSLYVILLQSAVAEHPSILRCNPNRDPAKPCLYVGMTGLPVEHRFENHKKVTNLHGR
jgi:hypothetical protein